MDDYFSSLSPAEPLDREALLKLARHSCLDIHRVTWCRAWLSADGQRMLCWFQARDAESVRHVLRQQGSPAAAVWRGRASCAADSAVAPDGQSSVCIEFDSPGEAATLETTALATLQIAGIPTGNAIRDADGRVVLVATNTQRDAVEHCLAGAGLVPTACWNCTEFDPRQESLFSEGAGRPVLPTAAGEPSFRENTDVDAIVIGAGLTGIYALYRLRRMGLRVQAFESAGDVGGVWHWNRYPGARVDSEIYTYGYSFSGELLDEWDWGELFAPQAEIERYLRHVTDRFDLRRHIRFDTRIAGATWNGDGCFWTVATDDGETLTCRYCIAATGVLSIPQTPDWPSMASFAGRSYHTARWPAEGVDLGNQRVGVVGTGASGVQVIQTIAPTVKALTVFQRTPTFCMPQRNRPLDDADRQEARRDWPQILAACRNSWSGFMHDFDSRSGLAVSAQQREALYEHLWQQPGFAFWFGNFADLMMNDEVNAHASEFVKRKIAARVNDPDIARKLLPDHPFGTKRVPLENGYYEVFNRANVRLVDLRATPVEAVTPAGIRLAGEEIPLDVIVYATGFDAGTGALSRIDIRGEDGLAIADKWRDGARTFLGMLVAGFPNFFVAAGPHNAASLCNAGRCIEQNVDWIASCLDYLHANGACRVEAEPASEDKWTAHVYDAVDGTVLSKMTDSWFFGANTPGKARRATVYAGGARAFREYCEQVAGTGYPGLVIS